MASTTLPPGGESGIRIWNRELVKRPVDEARSEARMAIANPYKKGAEPKPNA